MKNKRIHGLERTPLDSFHLHLAFSSINLIQFSFDFCFPHLPILNGLNCLIKGSEVATKLRLDFFGHQQWLLVWGVVVATAT